MTLFIDQSGQPDSVFSDLYTISGQDGGLGDQNVPSDATVVEVTYVETAGQPATADRLNTLVNTDFGTPIVMTALQGGIDPYSGLDVTGNGFTYIDSTSGSDIIRVVYDVSQCTGNGIFVFDVDGNHISLPNPVILYHELSHAFRAANGTTQTNDEIPAETDENVLRSELGFCLRDVNNHGGGCGNGDSCGGTTDCFIVSAATGSMKSAEVVRLKQQRDRIFRATDLGSRLLDAIYRDYYRFSPRIALDMKQDPVVRVSVLAVAVRPLIAWYSLANILALAPSDRDQIESAVDDLWEARPAGISGEMVLACLESIKTGVPLPPDVPDFVSYLMQRLSELPSLPFGTWAVLDPLLRVWSSFTSGGDLLNEAYSWLAAAPLEILPEPDRPTLDDELAFLARGPLSNNHARHEMGRRLRVAWPGARVALARHGFIEAGGSQ